MEPNSPVSIRDIMDYNNNDNEYYNRENTNINLIHQFNREQLVELLISFYYRHLLQSSTGVINEEQLTMYYNILNNNNENINHLINNFINSIDLQASSSPDIAVDSSAPAFPQLVSTRIEIQVICTETVEELIVPMECGICYDSHATIDFVGMNCGHTICKGCIKQCLRSRNTCPFCRGTVHSLYVKDPELVDFFSDIA
jgi:hypothetical protein